MKKKTWIISALMYAAVFAACFGVLHFMKKIIEPGSQASVPISAVRMEAGEETGDADQGNVTDESAEPVPVATGSQAEEIIREKGYKSWEKYFPGIWSPPQTEETPYVPPKVILATDLHYQSASGWDKGRAFQLFVERGDGKVVQYLPELLEAFIDEVMEEKPTALVLSGDITMNGEKMNHEELSARLKRVQDAGVQVLVIPGNHDINNTKASVFFGEEKEQAPWVTPQEFYDIYHEYGYDQALSKDQDSLSYVYELDEKNWLLMLDSCQYEPENLVEGRLKESTIAWAWEQLAEAKEKGVFVLPVAHHNLLAQSRMYTTQCAMENNQEVIGLLQYYEVPLFVSGHLHVQRIRKYKSEPGVPDGEYGIQEIITDALSIPPCQYGELVWELDGSLSYQTRAVDVSAWARRTGTDNEELLDFEDWSYRFIQELISNQIRGIVKNLGEDVEKSMAAVYAAVYMDYYAGREIDAKGVKSSKGYRFWERNMPDSYLLRELDAMIADSDRDHNYFLLPELTP